MSFRHRNFGRGVLLLLFAFESLLFWTVYKREVAWYPPMYFDQANYLVNSYRLQEDVLSHGFEKLWKAIWSPGHPTGIALSIEGALSGLIIGGARFPQLCINLILFLALQAVAFYSARALPETRFSGYILVGLILSQTTAWLEAGGLLDFRNDFAAYCLYGIWTCSVLRSKLFLGRGWAIACGLIGAYLVLHRFLTIVYLFEVLAGFAIVCVLFGFLARDDIAQRNRMWQRLKNLGFSSAALLIPAGPILLLNSATIWNYYVIGHVLNEEKYIRASNVGIHDLSGHLLFYPRSIVNDHLGQMFFWALAIAFVGGVTVRLLYRTTKIEPRPSWILFPLRRAGIAAASIVSAKPIAGPAKTLATTAPTSESVVQEDESNARLQRDPHASRQSRSAKSEIFWLQLIFLLAAIACPVLALTVDISKSPIVGGIVGVPIALLGVILAGALFSKHHQIASPLIAATAALIFGLGAYNQLSRSGRHWPEFADRAHLSQMAEFDEWLVGYATEYRWKNPAVSLDIISSALNAGTITAVGFEKTGQFVEFHGLLGSSIFGPSLEEALQLLAKSDFVILTSPRQPGSFPFTKTIETYWQDLKGWADKHLVIAKTQRFHTYYPYTATVYVRPSALLRDVSGDWITSQGVLIEAKRSDLERFPLVRLKGVADFSALPKIPAVTATLESSDESPLIPARFERAGNQYEVDIDTSSIRLPADQDVRIRLKFDTFYLRKDAALYNDFRELVVRSPDVSLLPAKKEFSTTPSSTKSD